MSPIVRGREAAPTRVLIVYHHLPHYRYDVFKRLEDDPTLEVEFAAAPRSSDGSIPTIPADALRRFHPLRNLWFGPFLWQVGLLRLMLRRRPQVVILLGVFAYLSSWFAAVLARPLGTGVLYWTIGWHRPEKGLRRRIRVLFYRLAPKLLIYGHVGKQIGVEMGYPADRMTVVFNSSSDPSPSAPADPAELARFAERLPAPGTLVVGAVIRLNPVKRLDLLIEAAAVIRQRGRDLTVVLVGDGPERSALVALADHRGVPLVLPGPAYSDAHLSLFYERSLVTVVPSAAGLTVLQSLKFGRPVITHDNAFEQMPECEAIIPHQTGDFYRYDDLHSLVDSIEAWLDRQSVESDEVAQRCRAVVQTTWSAANQSQIIGAEIHSAERRRRGRTRTDHQS